MKKKINLIGAGPGNIDLITLGALNKIKKSKLILYDRLINKKILDFCKKNCKLIYVGKKKKNHVFNQKKINFLMNKYSKIYKNLTRLKGGDSFIFGRGGEEAIFLKKNNITINIIPGISSSISIPIYAGIPLTMRNKINSILIMTGHTIKNKKINWKAISKMDTIIFLMSISQRKLIASKLIQEGKKENEKVAFIENGSTNLQKTYISTLLEIKNEDKLKIKSPAIMIISTTIDYYKKINWFKKNNILEKKYEKNKQNNIRNYTE